MSPTGAEATHAALALWESYYVITGSAAAALTGLQFVVQTLIAQGDVGARPGRPAERATAAFGSPTVVHFAAALLLSAGLSAPWPSPGSLRAVLLAAGLGGMAYTGVVFRRARRQTVYQPVLEDWVWHVGVPAGAYAGVAAAAGLMRDFAAALFAVAAVVLVLLCVGLHNAWDAVAFLTARPRAASADDRRPEPPRAADGT